MYFNTYICKCMYSIGMNKIVSFCPECQEWESLDDFSKRASDKLNTMVAFRKFDNVGHLGTEFVVGKELVKVFNTKCSRCDP